ncbi:MAG: hypothetical protein U0575_12200 [Phycisphaerales bacterium]
MKRFLTLAACCVAATLVACQGDQAANTPMAAGAVSGNKACCDDGKACCKDGAAMGAVTGDQSGCCKDAAAKTCPVTGAASMGAVDGEKSGCCKDAAAKTCPVTGATSGTSMGAVGDAATSGDGKTGCCKSACQKSSTPQ